MRFKNVVLEAFGYVLPEEIVTSSSLEDKLSTVYERLRLPFGRLAMMTGIHERRFFPAGTRPSEVAARAGDIALANAGVDKNSVDCLINTSVSRDFLEPATATVVHYRMGLPRKTFLFDISNACLGFLNGMVTMANMIEVGQIKRGVVVAGEVGRNLVERTVDKLLGDATLDRTAIKSSIASLTIGSAAVALVMAHPSVSACDHQLLGDASRNDTRYNHLCCGDALGGFGTSNDAPEMHTDSEQLLLHGCALAKETWGTLEENLNWSLGSVDRYFTHQVGAAHQKLMRESIGLDPAKDFTTYEYLGNTGAAALPVTMAIGIEKGLVKSGDNVAMLGIGSGINCQMLGVRW